MATVLVTGGAGFIGSHLVEGLIGKGYLVRVMDNLVSGRREWVPPGAEFIEADIADLDACRKATKGCEGIFHGAAVSRVLPGFETIEAYTRSNITGTQNILIAAHENKARKVVYSGSSSCYGDQPFPHLEDITPPKPVSFYGLTKWVGEEYCRMFDSAYGVPTVVLRYFNVYGPRQPQTGNYALVIGIFLKRQSAGEALLINGDGMQRRDFVHVRDVARAQIMAFESDARGATFNVGSGANISVKELADLISPRQEHRPPRHGDPRETLADITRIGKVLGWKPEVPFKTGLEELMRRTREGLE